MELNSIIILYSLLFYTLLITLHSVQTTLLFTLYTLLSSLLFTLYTLLSPSPSPPNMVYKCRTKGIVGEGKTPYLCTQKKYQR